MEKVRIRSGHVPAVLQIVLAILLFCGGLAAQPIITGAEYFIDTDPGPGNGIPINIALPDDSIDVIFNAPLAGLQPGYHRLVTRVKDSEGNWSVVQYALFYINPLVSPIIPPPPPFTLTQAEYFIGPDPGPGKGIAISLIAGDTIDIQRTLDFNGINPGQYLVGIRFRDLTGMWSVAKFQSLVVTDTAGVLPVVNFQPLTAIAGSPVTFTNTSTNLQPGALHQWDIDANGSVEYNTTNATHTFSTPGIYDVQLTVTNPGVPVSTSGLKAHYRFHNGSLTPTNGSFTNLTKVGNMYLSRGRSGEPSGGWSTDTVSALTYLRSAKANLGLDDFTVSYWFRGTNMRDAVRWLGGSQYIVSTQSNRHYVNVSSPYANADNGGGVTIHNNSWHHVAITWNRNTTGGFKSYLDGQLIQSVNAGNFLLNLIDSLIIGGATNANRAIGSFDDLYIFSRALNATEIDRLAKEAYISSVIKQIEVGPIPGNTLAVSGSLTFCSGDSVVLTAPPGSGWLWNTGSFTNSIVVKESGFYTCAYLDIYGKSRTTNTVEVVVLPTPDDVVLMVNHAVNGQANGSAWIALPFLAPDVYQYFWSTGSTAHAVSGLLPGNYGLTITDGNCQHILPFSVSDSIIQPLTGIVYAEYFFAPDPGVGNGVSLPVQQGEVINSVASIPVGGLSPGFHSVFIRVRDSNHNWSVIKGVNFSVVDSTVSVQPIQPLPDIVAVEYFFDANDPGPGNAIPLPGFATLDTAINTWASIPVTGLGVGFHRINIRAKDANGNWSIIRNQTFFVDIEAPPTLSSVLFPIMAAEYFFDNTDPGVGNGTPIPVTVGDSINVLRTVDVSQLSPGAHRISVRTLDVAGNWSITNAQTFTIATPACTTPVPGFTFPPANAGTPVNFTNTSTGTTGGVTWAWDINANGVTDYTTQNITHTFAQPGVYDVKLTVTNTAQCVAWLVQQVTIGPVISNLISANGSLEFCFGDSVILTAPSGTNFIWSNGDTTQSIVVKTTGNYQVTYLNIQGNAAVSNLVWVKVNPTMNIVLTAYNATNSQANGSAGVSVSGGNSFLYNYLWSNGATTPIIAQLSPGTYQITVNDGKCPETRTAQIQNTIVNNPPRVVFAEYFFDSPDPGPGNATPIVIPVGQSISSFANIDASNLSPGFHTINVRVKDDNYNWSFTRVQTFVINDPALDSALVIPRGDIVAAEYFFDEDPGPGNGTPITGFAFADSIMTNFSAPVGNLEFGFHRLAVRVKDSHGYWSVIQTQTFFIDIVPPPTLPDIRLPIVAAEYFFDNHDPGPGNGHPLSVPTSDSMNIVRTIPIGQLPTGVHRISIRVKDVAENWSVIRSNIFTIDTVNCPVPQVNFVQTPANAGQSVQLSSTSSNVSGSSQYSWDINANGTVDYSGSVANHTFSQPGIYDVKLTVSNGGNCVSSVVKQVEIGPFVGNQISASGPLELCEPDTLWLTAPNGSNFIWGNAATTQTIAVTESGWYQVTYEDIYNNLVSTPAIYVKVNPAMVTNLTVYNATNSQANGSAGLSVSGGSSYFYTYNWSNGASTHITTQLVAGNYTVTVSDGKCPVTLPFTVGNLILQPLVGIIAAECFFDDLDPGPGNATPLPITQGSPMGAFANIPLAGVQPGLHLLSVRVKDSNFNWSVTKTSLFYVSNPFDTVPYVPKGDIVAAEYFFDNSDPGPGNGQSLTVAVPASAINNNYSIPLTGLGPGNHLLSVRVKDNYGKWSITKTAGFQNCNPPASPVAGADIVVCTGSDVQLSASTVPGANYYWTGPNGFVSTLQNPLISAAQTTASGNYYVYAENPLDSGCYSVPDILLVRVDTIPGNPGIIQGTPTVCAGQTTGNYFVDPVPGAVNYTWHLPNGAFLLAGNNTNSIAVDFSTWTDSTGFISLTVSNSCGSAQSAPFVVTRYGQSVPATVTPNGPTTFCQGGNVQLNANTGSGLLYEWLRNGVVIPGATGPSYVATLSGNYTVWVRLSNQCGNSASVQITVNPAPAVSISDTLIGANQYAVASPSGGTAPYQYQWAGGGTAYFKLVTNPGTVYSVTVTDANGCTGTASQLINAPVMAVQLTGINVSCFGGANGSITTSVTGNAGPFSYSWSNGATTANLTGIPAGGYSVTVTGAGGATVSGSITLTQPPVLTLGGTVTDVSNPGWQDGAIAISVGGGSPPYQYGWSDGTTNQNLTGVIAGSYSVTVTDSKGCTISGTWQVGQPGGCTVAPDGLFASRITPTSVRLNWTVVSGAQDYLIRGRGVGFPNWVYYPVAGGSTNFKDVTRLFYSVQYEWQILAICNGGQDSSVWSALDMFTTDCYAPDTIWNDSILTNSAQLHWSKAWGAYAYEIRVRLAGTGSGVTIRVAGANAVKRTITGLSPNTSYEWRIRSYCFPNGYNNTAWTNWLPFSTGSGAKLFDSQGDFSDESYTEEPFLLIYPNPMESFAKLVFENPNSTPYELIVRDISGRVVFRQAGINGDNYNLSRNNLTPGVYFIELWGESIYRGKLVVQ